MELVNVFLETDTGKYKLIYNTVPCGRQGNEMDNAINYFISVLDDYVYIKDSLLYLAIKDGDIFYFSCDKGRVAPVENEFFIFDDVFAIAETTDNIRAVTFIITDRMPLSIRLRKNYTANVIANNKRYYGLI